MNLEEGLNAVKRIGRILTYPLDVFFFPTVLAAEYLHYNRDTETIKMREKAMGENRISSDAVVISYASKTIKPGSLL